MSSFEYDVGILGGGAAGLTVAAGASQFGAKTVLIEKEDKLGGDCLHYGCVPSKTLIRTSQVWHLARRAEEFGLPALTLPDVDLGRVMDRVADVIAKIQPHDSPERFCKLGAETLFGQPVFEDEHVVAVGGRRISAKHWVIATGSRPAIPAIEGIENVPYWTNETVFSQRDLPGELVVLGGGPIGIEMAQSFQRLGSKVTLIEYGDQIIGPEDADMAAIVQHKVEAEGLTIRLGLAAKKAEMAGKRIRLTLADVNTEASEVIEADALLLATGRRPNVDGLNLEAAGVNSTDRGIPTSLRLRTNQPHIYACGDINGKFPFTHVAGYEGGIALTNIVMHLPRRADYAKVPWCTYCDPEVASVGLNEKRAQKEGIDYKTLIEPFSGNDRALAEAETEGQIKVLLSPKGKLLGAQIVGHSAGELIHEWIAAVNGGVKLSTIAGMIHVYPTLAEISKRAAGSYFSEKLFSDRTKNVLRLLFQLKGRACTPDS